MTVMNDARGMLRFWFPREILIVFVLVAIVYTLFLPKSFFEFDETLFARAVVDYEPWKHHPPPPGYPVFIAIAGSLNWLIDDPFTTLVGLSLVSSVLGLLFLAHTFAAITGSVPAGAFGAALFYLSPVLLIHGTLPISEPPALALVFLAMLLFTRAHSCPESWFVPLAYGIAAGMAVGCRPQFSIVVVPFLFASIPVLSNWRARIVALMGFTAGCLLWLVPFILVLGGVEKFIAFELGQAAYYASHDAGISRGGWTLPRLAARFAARPWGPLWIAVPVVLIALAGAWRLAKRRASPAVPVIFASGAYLIFAIATMDPADGARYAIPSVIAVALCAGAAIGSGARSLPGWTILSIFAASSLAYTSPLLIDRSSGDSPPAAAAAWIRANVPKDAVILYELPLWPQATYWLSDFKIMKIDEGAPILAGSSEVPVYIYGNGGSHMDGAQVFWWEFNHAFRKVTRNHYGVVSVVEVPASQRYEIISGVYASERDPEYEWRWVAPLAEIQLPDLDADRVTLRMAISGTTPQETMPVRITVNGNPVGRVEIKRGRWTSAVVPLFDGPQQIGFQCEGAFVPAEASGGRGDPRQLCFQLLGVKQE